MKKGNKLHTAFGDYTVIGLIGAGGNGEVYEVEADDGSRLAAKILREESSSKEKMKRFRNEFLFGQLHKHKNIVPTIAYGITGNSPFFIMPKYDYPLRKVMKKLVQN